MSVNISPYDTLALVSVVQTQLVVELKKALRSGGLHIVEYAPYHLSTPMKIALVEGGNANADTIPLFAHPIIFDDEGQTWVMVDVRGFGSYDASKMQFGIRNRVEYDWQIRRACLTHLWNAGRVDSIRDMDKLPMAAYAKLISQSIARRYNLDMLEQYKASILAAFFYRCLFEATPITDPMQKHRAMAAIQTTLALPDLTLVKSVLEDVSYIDNAKELAELIKTKLQTHSLNDFNYGILIKCVGSSWYGSNAAETMLVGMEHVPTWIMMVYAALSSMTYKRSTLAKTIQDMAKNGKGQLFHSSIKQFLGNQDALTHYVVGRKETLSVEAFDTAPTQW